MASKTKVNGTAYTIKAGKTKINGTAYTIRKGITKIGGTSKTINFGYQINITGSGSNLTNSELYSSYAVVDGVTYTNATTIPSGKVVQIYGKAAMQRILTYRYTKVGVTLDGSSVGSTTGNTYNSYTLLYTYTATKNCTINLVYGQAYTSDYTTYVTIT